MMVGIRQACGLWPLSVIPSRILDLVNALGFLVERRIAENVLPSGLG